MSQSTARGEIDEWQPAPPGRCACAMPPVLPAVRCEATIADPTSITASINASSFLCGLLVARLGLNSPPVRGLGAASLHDRDPRAQITDSGSHSQAQPSC